MLTASTSGCLTYPVRRRTIPPQDGESCDVVKWELPHTIPPREVGSYHTRVEVVFAQGAGIPHTSRLAELVDGARLEIV